MKDSIWLYIVMYDITHPGTLKKVADTLQKNGYERINYSVWLGFTNPMQAGPVKQLLQKLLWAERAKGSLLYILPVKKNTMSAMRSITGHKPQALEYWLGETKNMFF